MKQIKLFYKKIIKSNFSIFFRNNINFKHVPFNMNKFKCSSISDCFPWRTDNNYKTIFKFSDILKQFYKVEDSNVEIHFYTKNNEFIKKIATRKLNLSNELIIDQNFLNLEDYGVFYIYHFSENKILEKDVISNRCYIGFSKDENLFSFVHGNAYSKTKNISSKEIINKDPINTTLLCTNFYKIQKLFDEYDKVELFFSNPTSNKIKIKIFQTDIKLNPYSSKIYEIKNKNIVAFKSNCLFLRPTIFCYKNNYLDVHHS